MQLIQLLTNQTDLNGWAYKRSMLRLTHPRIFGSSINNDVMILALSFRRTYRNDNHPTDADSTARVTTRYCK